MGNKKSQPVISIEEESVQAEWNGQFVDCDSVDWGVTEPMQERDNLRTLRATVFGTGGAGKSCLLTKWFCDRFSEEYDPTIENYYRKQLEVGDNAYTLEALDTAGQDEFAAMQDSWIHDANIFLLVFSMEDRDSFGYIKHMERKIARLKEGHPFALMLCGTKKDLAYWSDFDPLLFAPGMEAEQFLQHLLGGRPTDLIVSYLWEPRHVHYAEAVAFARERNMFSYVESSSFTGLNVDKTFRILAHCILISTHRFALQRKMEKDRRNSRGDLERRGSKGNLERRSSRSAMERRSSKNNLDKERRSSKSSGGGGGGALERRSSRGAVGRSASKGPGERSRGLSSERSRASDRNVLNDPTFNQPRGGPRNASVMQSKAAPSRTSHARSQSGGR